jgi:hypothetical protein
MEFPEVELKAAIGDYLISLYLDFRQKLAMDLLQDFHLACYHLA